MYASLFRRKEPYVKIVSALGAKPEGLTRDGLIEYAGLSDGGRTGKYLDELASCGFISKGHVVGHKSKESIFRLMDNYSLFYLRFVTGFGGESRRLWTERLETAEYYSWAGRAFERVCLMHVREIKRALEIGGVKTAEFAWRGVASDGKPAQIDLLIDRNDGIVDICEMKYTKEPCALDEAEWSRIARRRGALRGVLPPAKAIHVVMVTDSQMVQNAWSKEVMGFVTADDLFVQ